MSNKNPELVNQLITQSQLSDDTLSQGAPETNCNGSVDVSNWGANYNSSFGRLSMGAEVTPALQITSITFVRLVMMSLDKSEIYGAAFTFLLQGSDPAKVPGVTSFLNVVAPFSPPAPGTSILGRLDGTLQTPAGECQFYFEQVFQIS